MEDNYALFVLKKEFEVIKNRLDGDVIVDLRFRDEIEEDKRKLRQLKRSIEVLMSKSGSMKRTLQ